MPGMSNFDSKDFFEFLWLYERLARQKNKEQEEQNNSQGKNTLNFQDKFFNEVRSK